MAEKPEGYGETPESHATAQQVLTDFYDEFLKKMDANAVSMLLQAKEIISDGDSKTIQGHASLKQQNLILHRVLMKKCTDEAFKLACDVIIKADPTNAVMIELAENMKRRLEPHTGSHTGPIERLPDLHRKRPRSSSQSSEELVLQPYKRHHDYLDLKMDLLACDMSDLQGESDSNVIIRLLYSNTLRTIIKLLEPHLTDVKMEANRYCQLDLHHVKVTEEIIDSSASVQRLLNQMSVTGKWDNTRFLRKAVAAIPCSALEREVAEVVLSHYNLHLVYYERATLLKESLQSGNQEMSTDKNTNLVPLEITIPKAFNDVTREDCHRLQVCVLSTAYDIPEENITYYGAEERHSTTIIYLIPRQYISEIMQRNTQLETVWVLLELDVIEVAIPDVFLFKPSVDLCLNLLKNSRTFKVDLLGMTEVLPYQMYALLDSNVDPLMRFDRPKSGNTAGTQMSMKKMTCWNQFVTMSDSGEEVPTSEQGPGPAVSARVAKLVQDIYDEFQNIIDQFGPDAVQSLVPLVENVLENLDNALGESEDNGELVELKEQYEKERQRRKEAEERYFQLEDANGIEIRQLKEKVASMTAASQTATSKVQQQDEQISHLLDEIDKMKKEAADLKQRHNDTIKQHSETIEAMKEQIKFAELHRSGSFESDKVPGNQDYVTPAQSGGGWAKRKLPVVRKQRIESSDQATLEPPPRETSPTYSEDYHLGRRLPDNKRSLAMEMRKKGQQQNEGSEVEEEYSDEYEDVDLLEPDQFGPHAVQSLVPLVENLNTALGESEDNGELVELKENYKLLTQQYETERRQWREDEETIKQHSETIEAELRKLNELNRCYFNRGLCLLLLGVGLGVGLALSPKLLYLRLAIPTPIPS